MADARRVALDVVRRVRRTDAYSNRVLPAALTRARLSDRDAAFATELAYGTLRVSGTLDWIVSVFASREPEPDVADVLRLGTYQLRYMGVPAHAAVDSTVRLAPLRARGFVNAVLRRVATTEPPWPDPTTDPVTADALRLAHPAWILQLWSDELGAEHARALAAANNEVPPITVRATGDAAALSSRFAAAGLQAEAGRWHPAAITVRSGGSPAAWPGFDDGAFVVQDEASILVGEALGARPDDVVVDLCAGPGGKATDLAARARRLVAVEPRAGRAARVVEAARRVGVRVQVVVGDGRRAPVANGVDAVLVDAPCSGLGVLRRRPEARWRATSEDLAAAAVLQAELVEAAFDLLRPGGTLLYAVCTVSRAESQAIVAGLVGRARRSALEHVLPQLPRALDEGPCLQLLPHIHGTDGMFIARIRKG